MQDNLIEAYLATAEAVFRSFRSKLLSISGNVDFIEKRDGSPVTDLDVAIEQAVRDAIAENHTDLEVYGEEGGLHYDKQSTFLLIDPIDGTKSFINGTPTFTNMATLIDQGEAIGSIIYNPSTDMLFRAIRGKGAFKNDTRLDLSQTTVPPIAYCKDVLVDELNERFGSMLRFESPPSGGGNGFCMVANSEIAARFQVRGSGYPHDYAPGALLVSEAGGVLIPVDDQEQYSFETVRFIACHPGIAEVIRAELPAIRQFAS